ncbi:MAG: transketolase C-terminal domain-containing protein [Dehalococcoidia bacterium]
MLDISFIPYGEFERIQSAKVEKFEKLRIISDICRLNALSAVKLAGSGHLGSSFSAMDIVVFLYLHEMNTIAAGLDNPDRDVYFSSKGHDCPGHYSVLVASGMLPFDKLFKLRRLGGLDGHPDVSIPGIEANSGSLGMGISKAKGIAFAKKLGGHGGRTFVLTGDGELQEGQIWEALQTTAHQKLTDTHVIVDFNKIQTDKQVKDIIDLGDIERKFEDFGWYVHRCDGHNFIELEKAFTLFKDVTDKPKILIADTIKGKGISFMEGPVALKNGDGLYRWHSGAPDDDYYEAGYKEILDRINSKLYGIGLDPIKSQIIETRKKDRIRLKDVAEKIVDAYGEALVELGGKRKDMIVLDSDLAADCGLRLFEKTFPERFIENGIAEQDMVSMAGGLALQGFLPIVNSFGVFLASRANEQIYTNATEGTKIIYVCHYAGLIPAGPGKSHQSLRDISLFGALPNCTIVEPCKALETKSALVWCVNEARENCLLRLAISPSPGCIPLPTNYKFSFGKGTVIHHGNDTVLFAYGPVMLNEALIAAKLLQKRKCSLKVVNMPWLNKVDHDWFQDVVGDCESIFVLDNHSSYGSLGDYLINELMSSDKLRGRKLNKISIEEYPACGTPEEVLQSHKLDGESIMFRILEGITR